MTQKMISPPKWPVEIIVAVAVTGFIVSGAAVLAFSRMDEWADMGLNEWGDFAAGVFAPVAFIWLATTVLLQRQDLQITQAALIHETELARLQADLLQRAQMDAAIRLIIHQLHSVLPSEAAGGNVPGIKAFPGSDEDLALIAVGSLVAREIRQSWIDEPVGSIGLARLMGREDFETLVGWLCNIGSSTEAVSPTMRLLIGEAELLTVLTDEPYYSAWIGKVKAALG